MPICKQKITGMHPEYGLREYWAKLEACDDVSGVWNALIDFAGENRFSSVSYIPFYDKDNATLLGSHLLCEGAPEEWSREYYRRGFQNIDPIIQYAQQAPAPFRWHAVGSCMPLTKEQRHFMRVMREADFGDGVIFPVFAYGGQNAMLSLGYGDEKNEPSPFEQSWLQWVAQVTHARMLELRNRETSDTIGLSPREMEIMMLITRGLSNPAIASALGVSENTVGTHLRRIYRKLGVNARGAAVAKALSYGVLR